MGRTARQGKDGSYSMILLNSDLEKYLGVSIVLVGYICFRKSFACLQFVLNSEAIEIGLWHANNEFDKGRLSQVILIGDAPVKSKKQIIDNRNKYNGEKYWENTPFSEATYFETEICKLKKK